MVIIIESDTLTRILAYVVENKILETLEAESQQKMVVEAIKLEKSWVHQYGFTS